MSMPRTRIAITLLAALTGAATTVQGQLPARYVDQTVTAYGCATLGSEKWCAPSHWTFRHYPEYPRYIDFSAYFPGYCAYGSGMPSPPGGVGLPDCYTEMATVVPGLEKWRFSLGYSIRINTTSGPWWVCEGTTDCHEHPSTFGRVTEIKGYWLGFDTTDYWSQHSWLYTYTVTPEPATMTLLATGIAGIGGAAWRRRKRRNA